VVGAVGVLVVGAVGAPVLGAALGADETVVQVTLRWKIP